MDFNPLARKYDEIEHSDCSMCKTFAVNGWALGASQDVSQINDRVKCVHNGI